MLSPSKDEEEAPRYLPQGPPACNTVQWAPAVTLEVAKLAYKFWSLPDTKLGDDVKKGECSFLPKDQPEHALAKNVYEHLNDTRETLGPLAGCHHEKLENRRWTYEEVFGQDDPKSKEVIVNGKSLTDKRYWTFKWLRGELSKRGLDTTGKREDLERRLYDEERHRILPRSDLRYMNIDRDRDGTKHAIKLTPDQDISTLDMYTSAIKLNPYNPAYWLSRAYCHYQLAFFDLALGDASRALLLCDVIAEPDLKYSLNRLDEKAIHAMEQHIYAMHGDDENAPEVQQMREKGVPSFVPTLYKAILNVIALSLLALQCWDDYDSMERFAVKEFNLTRADYKPLQSNMWTTDMLPLFAYRQRRERADVYFHEIRAGGCPGGRKYPYEADDKNRYTETFVNHLDSIFAVMLPWKKFELGVRSIPDDPARETLGMFATDPIKKDEVLFIADASISARLSLNGILPDQTIVPTEGSTCDNCGKAISPEDCKIHHHQAVEASAETPLDVCLCFAQPVPIHFCPQNSKIPGCVQDAQSRYHYQACGKDWQWLHDSMRPTVCTTNSKPYFDDTHEDHGTIMSLLLRHIFDRTLLLRKQHNDPNLMAHELDELIMLESHRDWPSQHFPFTYAANIEVPFDILMALGVDIFTDLSFDTWVIQTVLKKLYVSVIPGELHHREPAKTVKNKPPPADEQHRMIQDGEDLSKFDPTFPTLCFFPDFSMFNHACWGAHNANWGYDDGLANRLIVWASKDIQAGEEICIPYPHKEVESDEALQKVLGQKCFCTKHRDGGRKRKLFEPEPRPERPAKRRKTGRTSFGSARSYNLRSRRAR